MSVRAHGFEHRVRRRGLCNLYPRPDILQPAELSLAPKRQWWDDPLQPGKASDLAPVKSKLFPTIAQTAITAVVVSVFLSLHNRPAVMKAEDRRKSDATE